jgi:hypothetical protein
MLASGLDRLGASIDQAIERELLETAGLVTGDRGEWSGAHPTRTAPADLMQSMLASASAEGQGGGEITRSGPTARKALDRDLQPAPAPVRPGRRAPEVDEELDLPALLGRAFADAYTGRLRLRRGDTEKNVFFEVGRPVLASSNAVEDRMIEIFLRHGRISPEQHREAVRAAAETNRRMGTLLIELGIMKSDELLPAVREHYEEIIFSLFTWSRASVRREAGAVADPRRVRLLRHPAALAYAGLQRVSDRVRLAARLGPPGQPLRLASGRGASELLDELSVDPGLRAAIALFDGSRGLDDVLRSSERPPEEVLRVSSVLQAFGLLELSREASEAGGQAEDERIARARVAARLRLVREGDYFEFLGLPRDAETMDVRRAHARLCRDLEPEVVGPALARELADSIRDIRAVADEAWRVLGSEAQRTAYRAALESAEGGALGSSAAPLAEGAAGEGGPGAPASEPPGTPGGASPPPG